MAGNLKNTLDEDGVKELISVLFPSYPHRISARNIDEFFEVFGRNGIKSRECCWADIRKSLREQNKIHLSNDSILIQSALNPNSWLINLWTTLTKFIALYYFIAVPARISFVPWSTMLEVGALATDLVADIFTATNIFIMGNTAYMSSRSSWVTKRLKIFRRIDIGYILSALPLDWSELDFAENYVVFRFLMLPWATILTGLATFWEHPKRFSFLSKLIF